MKYRQFLPLLFILIVLKFIILPLRDIAISMEFYQFLASTPQISDSSKLYYFQENQDICLKENEKVSRLRPQTQNWETLFRPTGIDQEITFVKPSPFKGDNYLIGTTKGLYTIDQTNKAVSVSISSSENTTYFDLQEDPFRSGHFLAATSEGLYQKTKADPKWRKKIIPFYAKNIHTIAYHPNLKDHLFFASDEGLYREVKGAFEKIFSLQEQEEKEEEVELEKGIKTNVRNKSFIFSNDQDAFIMYSNERGNYTSSNFGYTWQRSLRPTDSSHSVLPLEYHDKTYLLAARNKKLSITDIEGRSGLLPLFSLPKQADLFTLYNNELLFIQNQKLYRYLIQPQQITEIEQTHFQIKGIHSQTTLPSIRQLQLAALGYSHLSTNRLKSWDRRVRTRSLLPSLSFDLDRSISNNIDIDRGSTSSPDVFVDGPDDRDWDFNVGVEWDLADLIWNDTETSIEIRKRALVEQRDEILDEINHLYFEWQRLELQKQQIEAQTNHVVGAELPKNVGAGQSKTVGAGFPRPNIGQGDPAPTNISIDQSIPFIEIQQAEILARLDGLTGGYISKWDK